MDVEALRQMMDQVAEKAAQAAAQQLLGGMNLDNRIAQQVEMPCNEGDDDMAKKQIRRRVLIDGKVCWLTAANEQEYAEKLVAAMTGGKSKPSGSKHPFEQYARRWFEVFSKPNVSVTTAVTYERQMLLHILPVLGRKNIEDITTYDVQRVFNEMDAKGNQKRKSSKDKVKMVLNMILQHAVEEGIIDKNPLQSTTIRIKGLPSEPTKPYSVEQMKWIATHIDDVQNPKDRTFIALLALLPLRLEEVLGLRWCDVDLAKGKIHISCTVIHPQRNQGIFQEMTKTDQSRRTISMVPQIQRFLQPGAANEFLVGGRIIQSYQHVQDMCERIQKDMGFDEPITPRRFRTTVLTDLYDQTKDIKQTQAAAGHTTATMTLKHYVKGREQNGDTATPIASIYGLM